MNELEKRLAERHARERQWKKCKRLILESNGEVDMCPKYKKKECPMKCNYSINKLYSNYNRVGEQN